MWGRNSTYIVLANEGDARDNDGFSEEARVGDEEYILDPIAFPNAARSFSNWDSAGEQVFDSGSDFETRLATLQQSGVDAWNNDRSDDKVPEPESVTVGRLAGKPVGFIGLERTSGTLLMIY